MTTTTNWKQITAKYSGKCVRCGGVIPSGTQCQWTRDEGVRHINCTATAVAQYNSSADYQHACDNALGDNAAPRSNGTVAVTMGVFKKDGRIYVVKPNRERTRVYAKEIVESPARMTENGLVADFTTVYRPGIVFQLTEADRWQLADAKDFLTRFAKCIVCGRHLKAAKSVAGSIGPVCAKYFAHSHACDDKPVVKLAQVKAQADMDTEDQSMRATLEHIVAAEDNSLDSSHANGCAHHGSAAPDGAAAAVNSIAKSPKTLAELAQAMMDDGTDTSPCTPNYVPTPAQHEGVCGKCGEPFSGCTSDYHCKHNQKMNALRAAPLTADEQFLMAEIKRMNRESDAWQKAAPGRWAGLLVEDIAHWRDYGITSVAAFDAMQAAEDEKERRKAAYSMD